MTVVHAADWVLPIEAPPVERGGVAVEDGLIVAVGPADELDGDRVEYAGCVILPGLVNAHTHLEYAAFAAFGDGLPFADWIRLHIQRKRLLGDDELLASARLGAVACLEAGITAVGDASYAGASARACAEAGLRAIVHLEVFGGDVAAAAERFDGLHEIAAPHADGALVRLGVSPHAPYTTGPDVYAFAHGLDLPVATHLAESPSEDAFMRYGTGPLAELASWAGIESPGTGSVAHVLDGPGLGARASAAHCVHADTDDVRRLAEGRVGVVHCPRSNALLGCGVAPVAELLAAGVAVGLGTDSPASAPSFDLFEEMRSAVELARARELRPDALTAQQALELATIGGARALGLADEIGSLAAGKRADVVVLDLRRTLHEPVEDPSAAIVFAGSAARVSRTIVDGSVRYDRGGSAWPEVREAASAARARMLGRALSSR